MPHHSPQSLRLIYELVITSSGLLPPIIFHNAHGSFTFQRRQKHRSWRGGGLWGGERRPTGEGGVHQPVVFPAVWPQGAGDAVSTCPWRSASPFARPAGDPREGALAGPGLGLDEAVMLEQLWVQNHISRVWI